jgi:magnesium transporter
MTPSSSPNLDDSLTRIRSLLNEQDLVRGLVHKTEMRRHEVVEDLVARQYRNELRRQINHLHPADIAHLLETLRTDERRMLWDLVDDRYRGAVLLELSDPVRSGLMETIPAEELVHVAENLDSDDIADLVPDLPGHVVPRLLQRLDTADRTQVESVLAFPEGSVGALMDFDLAAVREDVSLDVVLRYLRRRGRLPAASDRLMVVDRGGVLRGTLGIAALVVHLPETLVADVMDKDPVRFHTNDDAADAARAFERYDLIVAPVVNTHQQLVGCLKVDDMLDHLRHASHKDVLAPVGLSEDEDMFAPPWRAARGRWAWIALNLMTAFIASRIIGQFEGTIEKIVALAALMPIVASVGGNTGQQTLALMIQGMALKQVDAGNFRHLLSKEVGVALINGLLWGGVMGVITWALYGQLPLGVIMFAAMVLNLLLAAMAGALVPMALKRAGQDPALGSSIILTGCTDSFGFLIFLGLAAGFLGR